MVNFRKHIGLGVGFNSGSFGVNALSGNPPVNTVAPVITGTLNVGSVLTCSNGTWINGVDTYDYQWKRGATNIGTNSPNYTQVIDDEGQNITCTVTATNGYGSNSQVSNTVVTEMYLLTLFNTYVGRNQWAAQNSLVSGTSTTWYDYATTHNLINPAATNQPTTNDPDSDFNNKKSATFVTNDYLIKNTANYGAGQTTGSFWAVVKTPATFTSAGVFTCSDNASANRYIYFSFNNFGYPIFAVNNGTTLFSLRAKTLLSVNTEYIIEVESNGSATTIYVNGVLQDTTPVVGTNLGQWFDYANNGNTLDNIAIGSWQSSTPNYFSGKVALIGNYPLSAGDRTAIFNALNSYYNVY